MNLDLAADSGSDGFLMNWWEFLDVFMDVHVKCWNSPRRILRNHGTLVPCLTCCDRCHACAVWCSCRNSHFFTSLRGLWGWIVVPAMEMLWFIAPRNYLPYLVGGIPTPPKNDGVRQLGWWHSQYMESHKAPWFQSPPTRHPFYSYWSYVWQLSNAPSTEHDQHHWLRG